MGNKTFSLWDGVTLFLSMIGLVLIGIEFNGWWFEIYEAGHVVFTINIIGFFAMVIILFAAFGTIATALSED